MLNILDLNVQITLKLFMCTYALPKYYTLFSIFLKNQILLFLSDATSKIYLLTQLCSGALDYYVKSG